MREIGNEIDTNRKATQYLPEPSIVGESCRSGREKAKGDQGSRSTDRHSPAGHFKLQWLAPIAKAGQIEKEWANDLLSLVKKE